MKKIAHFCSNIWYSALTEYALNTALALKNLGYENHFYVLPETLILKRAGDLNFRTIVCKGFDLSHYVTVRNLLSQENYDCVLAYEGKEAFLLSLILRNKSAPRFIRFKGRAQQKYNPFSQGIMSVMNLRKVDVTIVPSNAVLSRVVNEKNCVVIPMGIDTKKFFRRGNSKNDYCKIMIVGRFDPVKGHKEFLPCFKRALQIWPENLPKLKLQIIGHPENISTPTLKGIVQENSLSLGQDVEIIDTIVDHLNEYLSEASLGVISSLGSEVICRVGPEFLLCGTPIFVSGVGALEEILFEGGGASYKGLSIDETAIKMVSLVKESFAETEEQKIKRAKRAFELYGLETMAKKLSAFV